MPRTTFTRPDWEKLSHNQTQRDAKELYGNDGLSIGSQQVFSLPNIAVQKMQISVSESTVRESEVRNVPEALGIVDVDCDGQVEWNIHGRVFSLAGRRQMVLYMPCPEDGFKQIYHSGARMRMNGAFASMEHVRQLAESNPDSLGAICDIVERFRGDDGAVDVSEHMGSPMLQNCLAAICARPRLGNASEEFLFDNMTTYLGSLAEKNSPVSLRKARYDAALRSKIHEAREIISSNIAAPLSLAQIARAIGTNENYLKAGFRHEFGTTAFGYLYECRMQAACKLLLETSLTIDQIAQAVGYTDPVGFYAPFKRRFGLTPSQYRALK